MMGFSKEVTTVLDQQHISVANFATRMGFSIQHTYGLLRNSKRWNEDSINKACKILGLKIEFKSEGR
jgi:hypothetical protein